MRATFTEDGVDIFREVLTAADCDALIEAIAAVPASRSRRAAGLRNLLQDCPAVAALALHQDIRGLLEARLQREVFPVRALFFDKTETANWSMPWHQDTVIAVAEKIETPGFGPWSSKAGVVHVQPPREILEDMAAIRLHLDDCDAGNGALKISPGSHLHGILSDAEIDRWKQNGVTVCEVPKGGALLMRPLVLHASSAATQPRHRRVIHIEYASGNLPNGLRWFERK
jgi:ectoine hydroxylase-related dioxygenase (phytanoyl-CoA dioxygenase family)